MSVKLCNTGYKNDSSKQVKLFNDCRESDLSGQNLSGVNFNGVNLTGANLTNANLTSSIGIDEEKLKKTTILCNTKLPSGQKYFADCRNADLTSQDLSGVDLRDSRIDFTNATLQDATGFDIPGTNVNAKFCNTTLSDGIKRFDNCQGSNLAKKDLKGLNLALAGANFTKADLSGANLSGANLTGLTFINANLTNANLENSILDTKSLKKVKKLCNTILPSGIKSFEKCKGANLTDADLTNADLTKAKGLELQQLEKVKLCNTKLPALLSARNIENRDCPKK
jgi:uncharacterized protein YjbI with pentapeptide repeats